MKNIFLKILKATKDLFFPHTCICCKNYIGQEGLCRDCWGRIKWISEPKCKVCGKPQESDIICPSCLKVKNCFDKAVSVFSYQDFSKRMILEFKNEDATYFAPIFAQWMNRAIQDFSYEIDVMVPVPISFWRRIMRGYNQTELLSQELHKISGIDYEPRVLQKSIRTDSQKGLSRYQRLINLRRSFSVNDKYIDAVRNKVILLVDDVITTGATANECAKLLKKFGATKVYVVTVARVDFN